MVYSRIAASSIHLENPSGYCRRCSNTGGLKKIEIVHIEFTHLQVSGTLKLESFHSATIIRKVNIICFLNLLYFAISDFSFTFVVVVLKFTIIMVI